MRQGFRPETRALPPATTVHPASSEVANQPATLLSLVWQPPSRILPQPVESLMETGIAPDPVILASDHPRHGAGMIPSPLMRVRINFTAASAPGRRTAAWWRPLHFEVHASTSSETFAFITWKQPRMTLSPVVAYSARRKGHTRIIRAPVNCFTKFIASSCLSVPAGTRRSLPGRPRPPRLAGSLGLRGCWWLGWTRLGGVF